MDSITHALPATPKQIAYARSLALRNQTLLPWEVQQDRRSLSAWIDAQAQREPVSDMDRLPTSKVVSPAPQALPPPSSRTARPQSAGASPQGFFAPSRPRAAFSHSHSVGSRAPRKAQ